jgi:predicted secreted protein
MATKQGKDDILQVSVDSGTTWLTLVCESSHTFNFTRNTSTQATKCDGGTSARILGSYEWSFQSSVVVKTDPSVSEASYELLLSWAQGGTALLLRNADPSPAGTNFYHYGTVYVTDLTKTAETDGLVTADVTFSGDGALDITP